MAKSTEKRAAKSDPSIEEFQAEFDRERPRAERLLVCARDEIGALLDQSSIALGVPIEARVKEWASIAEKLRRKTLSLSKITDLSDLVGIRLILLFRQDLVRVADLIQQNFDILEAEDTAERLDDSQFGYQSRHFVVRVKSQWLAVPRYSDLGTMAIELQVRTLAQHMWAAASHKLQYKREESVPLPLRRTIYRVSALLETVDLELDRVLNERFEYIKEEKESPNPAANLNVDLIHLIAREMLPENNYEEDLRGFDEVLRELEVVGVNTTSEFRDLIAVTLDRVMAEDRKVAADASAEPFGNPERIQRGGFFTHVGLIRQAIIERFGKDGYEEAKRRAGTERG